MAPNWLKRASYLYPRGFIPVTLEVTQEQKMDLRFIQTRSGMQSFHKRDHPSSLLVNKADKGKSRSGEVSNAKPVTLIMDALRDNINGDIKTSRK